MRTPEELREIHSPGSRRAFGAVRRMAISFTQNVLWQLAGVRSYDGSQETRQVEPFSGIGFYSRPSSSGAPEAIAVMVGDANAPVIVATRDEKTRAASAGDLAPDESAMFTTTARVRIAANGTVILCAIGGDDLAQPMILGTTYRTAEDTLFTAIGVIVEAIGSLAVLLQTAAPTLTGAPADVAAYNTAAGALPGLLTTFGDAIATFQGAAASYLATVGKVQ